MASSFTLSLEGFREKVGDNIGIAMRKLCIDMTTRIVMRSPVGNKELWAENIDRKSLGLPALPAGYVGGRFRANWYANLDMPNIMTTPQLDKDGSKAISRAAREINSLDVMAESDIWITNSLPYSIPLEWGHSDQAPGGMVRITVTEFQDMVNAATRGLK